MTLVRGEVIERIAWDEGLITLRVAADVPTFEPGQFVNVALERDGELVRRAYSLASVPGDPLELYLVHVPGGALTPALLALSVGDEVLVDDQPKGFFTMSYVPSARDGWLVSTGTGIAPYLSMLRSGRVWQRFERVLVVHGVRFNSHLAYRDEIERCAADGRVVYLPLVSREEPRAALAGRVTHALADGRLEEAAGVALAPDHAHVMLCGNPEMIRDMTPLLEARGMRRHRIKKPGHFTIEKWW